MDDKKPEPTPTEAPEPAQPQAKDPTEPARKPGYVFKILPADPKNAFDFEDVADK